MRRCSSCAFDFKIVPSQDRAVKRLDKPIKSPPQTFKTHRDGGVSRGHRQNQLHSWRASWRASWRIGMISLFVLILCCCAAIISGKFNITVVRNDGSKKFFLIYDFKVNKTSRALPDETTVSELGFNPSEVKAMSDIDLSQYMVGPPVPSLIKAAINPDEVLRVAIQRAKAMNPVGFTTLVQKFGYFNPSFAMWNDRVLMAWCVASSHKGDPLESNAQHKGEIHFAWLEKGSYYQVSNETLYGIGPDYFLSPYEPNTKFFEDARLMVLSNNSLLISYAGVDIFGGISFRKAILTINKETGKVERSGSTVTFNEKNWITLEYDKKIYYVRNVNPLHISEVVLQEGKEVITNVVQLSKVPMPWHPAYIEHTYRGSTPAILVKGVYLAFFHTRAIIQTNSKRFTYFMGAMTLCPHYPFHVRSMSEYPILEPGWYEGAWLYTFFDYIVYPAGIILSSDGKTVYVSNGYQNRDLQVLSFDVEDLFDSLATVNDCADASQPPAAVVH